MKKLLFTTAIVSALTITPALAADNVVIKDADTPAKTTVKTKKTETVSDLDRVDVRKTTTTIVAGEISKMDILRHHDWDNDGDPDHKHTVVTINGMNYDEFSELVGDQNNDGAIDHRDILAYVGDTDNDGDVDKYDYINRFGKENLKIKQTYDYDRNYDGSKPYYAEAKTEMRSYQANEYGEVDPDVNADIDNDGVREETSLWNRFKSSFK